MNDTLGADCIGHPIITKYLKEKISWYWYLTPISSRILKRKISLMKQFLGLLMNPPFSHSARLPKEYSFQWVRFDIIWAIL
jgi:hypothetical protein